MEQRLWRECEHQLASTIAAGGGSLPLRTISLIRSLIINHSTSDQTISSILEALIHLLHQDHHHHRNLQLQHILPLFLDLTRSRPPISQLIFDTVLALCSSLIGATDSSSDLIVDALSLLISLAEGSPALRSAIKTLDDSQLVSICFRSCLRARLWFLNNVMWFGVRPHLLVTVLLGFTKDPYPYVRKAALNGLTSICKSEIVIEDIGLVEGCYLRAVDLLTDADNCVRVAAINAVYEWGQMLVSSQDEASKEDCSDSLFLQLCSMVRDMSVPVRAEALCALGRVGLVSEDILLQTLAKKVLGINKEKKAMNLCNVKQYKVHASFAAGVFVHGLEDDYSSVRRTACDSLRALVLLSAQFTNQALNLLMDVLNDDSMIVRLQAVETICYMAKECCIKMQEGHVGVLCRTLLDHSSQVRSGAMDILGSIHLPNMALLKLSVESLLGNLDMYPQEEAHILYALFKVGQNHGNFAIKIVKLVNNEITDSCGGKLEFDRPQLVGFLVLAISVSLSDETCLRFLPPSVLSYAAVFLGKISHALSDVMDQWSLLAYLSQCNGLKFVSTLKSGDGFLGNTEHDANISSNIQQSSIRGSTPCQVDDFDVEIGSECKSGKSLLRKCQHETHVEVMKPLKLIFSSIRDSWGYIKLGYLSEALKESRSCKEELEIIRSNTIEFSGTFAFALEYIQVVKLLGKLWREVLPSQTQLHGMEDYDLLLGKLDKRLLGLTYRFKGLNKEDELVVFELILLSCVLKLSKAHRCSQTLSKLSTTISYVNSLCKEESIVSSEFVNQVVKLCSEEGTLNEATASPFLFKKLPELFYLREFEPSLNIRQIRAEMDIPGFDLDNPTSFISGLPIGISLRITLYNVGRENRLWIKMMVDDKLTQFVFLHPEQVGSCNKVREFTFKAPFYKTPKAAAFTMKISIGMECLLEELHPIKGCGGPRHALSYLCGEKEVHFRTLNNSE